MDAVAVELGNEDVGITSTHQIADTAAGIEVCRALKLACCVKVPGRVHRDAMCCLGCASTHAASPDVDAVAVELGNKNVLLSSTDQIADAPAGIEVCRALKEARCVDVSRRVHRDSICNIAAASTHAARPDQGSGAIDLGHEDVQAPGTGQIADTSPGIKIHGS